VSSGPGKARPIRRIALGLDHHLDEFARRHSAETWKEFARDHPLEWQAAFLEVMNDPNAEVVFNLRGIDIWAGVNRAAVGRGGPTDWELLQIQQNDAWWPRVAWFDDREPRPNPFE
jgi:hypothetical protein